MTLSQQKRNIDRAVDNTIKQQYGSYDAARRKTGISSTGRLKAYVATNLIPQKNTTSFRQALAVYTQEQTGKAESAAQQAASLARAGQAEVAQATAAGRTVEQYRRDLAAQQVAANVKAGAERERQRSFERATQGQTAEQVIREIRYQQDPAGSPFLYNISIPDYVVKQSRIDKRGYASPPSNTSPTGSTYYARLVSAIERADEARSQEAPLASSKKEFRQRFIRRVAENIKEPIKGFGMYTRSATAAFVNSPGARTYQLGQFIKDPKRYTSKVSYYAKNPELIYYSQASTLTSRPVQSAAIAAGAIGAYALGGWAAFGVQAATATGAGYMGAKTFQRPTPENFADTSMLIVPLIKTFRTGISRTINVVDAKTAKYNPFRDFYVKKLPQGIEPHKGSFDQYLLRYKGDSFVRQGKTFGVTRRQAFNIKDPNTYVDSALRGLTRNKKYAPGRIKRFSNIGEDVVLKNTPSEYATPAMELRLSGVQSVASAKPDTTYLTKANVPFLNEGSNQVKVLLGGGQQLETVSGRAGVGGIELGEFAAPRTIKPIVTPEFTVPSGTRQIYTYYALGGDGDYSFTLNPFKQNRPGVGISEEFVSPLPRGAGKLSYEALSQRLGYDVGKVQLSASTLKGVRTESEVVKSLGTDSLVSGFRERIKLPTGAELKVFKTQVLLPTKSGAIKSTEYLIGAVKERIKSVSRFGDDDPVVRSIVSREQRNLGRLEAQLESFKSMSYKRFPGYESRTTVGYARKGGKGLPTARYESATAAENVFLRASGVSKSAKGSYRLLSAPLVGVSKASRASVSSSLSGGVSGLVSSSVASKSLSNLSSAVSSSSRASSASLSAKSSVVSGSVSSSWSRLSSLVSSSSSLKSSSFSGSSSSGSSSFFSGSGSGSGGSGSGSSYYGGSSPPPPPYYQPERRGDGKGLFDVFVRKRGKDIRINLKGLSIKDATSKLRSELKGTARASGFLVSKATGKKVASGLGGAEFRMSKADPFRTVQRRSFRISSRGELAEITAKGVAKNRLRGRLF